MGETLFWLAVGAGGLVWLIRHLSTHNRRTCPRCRGAARIRSGVFGERFRLCPRCKGSGWVRGLGGRPE
jgi:DnaJ-class molecular chaperone